MKIKIDENESSRFKKALFGDYSNKIKTFAILSAENPNGIQAPVKVNNENTRKFKILLKEMGLQYIPLIGQFRNKEHSFLVINLSLADAKSISKAFEQLSFFYGINNSNRLKDDRRDTASSIEYWERPNEKSDYEKLETSEKIEDAKDLQDFFSRHGDYKFSIKMDIFEGTDAELENIKEIKNEELLDKSLDDRCTGFHSRELRCKAYKG